jgi:ParB family chromosome partitioning protein
MVTVKENPKAAAKPAANKKSTPKKAAPKKEPAKPASGMATASSVGPDNIEDLHHLPVKNLHVEKGANPRKRFDREALKGLAQDIKLRGILNPLTVVNRKGKIVVVAGERRYRAAQLAKLDKVPVRFVRDDEDEIEGARVAENFHQQKLHPLEEAMAMKRLMGRKITLPGDKVPTFMNTKGLAKYFSVTSGLVSQRMALLEMPQPVQDALLKDQITVSQARELQTVKDEKLQLKLLQRIKNSTEPVRVQDIKREVEKRGAKKKTTKSGKARGRPPVEDSTAPNVARQGAEKAIEHLGQAKVTPRKVTELREGLATVYTRFERAKSDERKAFYKGMLAGLEWCGSFRENL